MRKIIMMVLLGCISAAPALGQILELQYLTVPRQHMGEFMELHKEMIERSVEGPSTITGHWVYAHAYAGPYSLVVVNRYDDAVAMEQDSSLIGIQNHLDALTDSTEKAAYQDKVNKWFSWYLEGHWDEVRTVREGGFFVENFDPTKKHVVVVGHYNPAWSKLNEFAELYSENITKPAQDAGYAHGVAYNTHFRGDGANFSSVTWFHSWEDFGKSVGQQAGQDGDTEGMQKLWEIAGDHHDEIVVTVGTLVDGEFVMSEW